MSTPSAAFPSLGKAVNFQRQSFDPKLLFPATLFLSHHPTKNPFHLPSHSRRRLSFSLPRLSASGNEFPPGDDESGKPKTPQKNPFSSKEVFAKLKRYGSCGVLAYGLLNTAYYTAAFLLVWFYVAPSPGRLGYFAAVQRFVKVMAMVWAGSQVTKVARAASALALAPFVEKGLSWFADRFKFQSRARAYATVGGICVGMALMLFLAVTVLWA
uniref:Uncharacterized protein n=1 Tax=Kalanchoe fedtschenkoi TaxID=63787 RepID=A0A7N0T272_KALFE